MIHAGKWTFECESWPDLAKQFKGAESMTGILDAFMGRVLLPAVTVKRLASGE